MHGDIDHPDSAVLTKDDYEHYQVKYGQFITALSGDLVAKMFLFLGFSFTDPNLDYILSRVRISHTDDRATTIAFQTMSAVRFSSDDKFRYADIKQHLALNDLKRFGVQTLLVNSYSDVTALLKQIENRYKRRTVFISEVLMFWGMGIRTRRALHSRTGTGACQERQQNSIGFWIGRGKSRLTGALEELYQHQGNASMMN